MSKEKKQYEAVNRDPQFLDAEFAFNNMLTLTPELKDYLNKQGLDWRFLNASQIRKSGGIHHSHWKAFQVPPDLSKDIVGTTPEGVVQRGDLILGVRPKTLSAKHREVLAKKNHYYNNFAKEQAREMREEVRRKGLSGVSIKEGYGKDDGGDDE